MRFKLIVVAVTTDLTDRIVDAAKESGATGATIIPSRGTGIHEARTFFGLTLETQRDVILFIVDEGLVQEILKTVRKAGEFDQPGTGIAFSLDIEQVVGLESQIPRFAKKIKRANA